ncbi:hypothetical protein RhiLY_05683 [Ceratobasidium sp. AG-Ba]|nr:hypothetical protein RhiLY_05683 [Ceratobasidium sp. AG-Ba]
MGPPHPSPTARSTSPPSTPSPRPSRPRPPVAAAACARATPTTKTSATPRASAEGLPTRPPHSRLCPAERTWLTPAAHAPTRLARYPAAPPQPNPTLSFRRLAHKPAEAKLSAEHRCPSDVTNRVLEREHTTTTPSPDLIFNMSPVLGLDGPARSYRVASRLSGEPEVSADCEIEVPVERLAISCSRPSRESPFLYSYTPHLPVPDPNTNPRPRLAPRASTAPRSYRRLAPQRRTEVSADCEIEVPVERLAISCSRPSRESPFLYSYTPHLPVPEPQYESSTAFSTSRETSDREEYGLSPASATTSALVDDLAETAAYLIEPPMMPPSADCTPSRTRFPPGPVDVDQQSRTAYSHPQAIPARALRLWGCQCLARLSSLGACPCSPLGQGPKGHARADRKPRREAKHPSPAPRPTSPTNGAAPPMLSPSPLMPPSPPKRKKRFFIAGVGESYDGDMDSELSSWQ